MAIVKDYKNDFNFAYKGFQYPVPDSWKRAVRLEDQIEWLLQALMIVNENGVTRPDLDAAVAHLQDEHYDILKDQLLAHERHADERMRRDKADVVEQIACVAKSLDNAKMGRFRFRDLSTGMEGTPYQNLRHAHDTVLEYAMTYDELSATGLTYAHLSLLGLYFKLLDWVFAPVHKHPQPRPKRCADPCGHPHDLALNPIMPCETPHWHWCYKPAPRRCRPAHCWTYMDLHVNALRMIGETFGLRYVEHVERFEGAGVQPRCHVIYVRALGDCCIYALPEPHSTCCPDSDGSDSDGSSCGCETATTYGIIDSVGYCYKEE